MRHPKNIKGFKTIKEAAEKIADLQYDILQNFLSDLAKEIDNQSKADKKRNREQLAKALAKASRNLKKASFNIEEAWKISKPYM